MLHPESQTSKELLQSVLDQLNEWATPTKLVSAYQVTRPRRSQLGSTKKSQIRKDATRSDRRFWRKYFAAECQTYYGPLFSKLTEPDARLEKWELEDLVGTVQKGARIRWRVVGDESAARVITELDFDKSPAARWAYAVLVLADSDRVRSKFYVITCRYEHCRKLAIGEIGHRGRRKSKYCCPEHGLAQAQLMARRRKAAAAKHK